MRRIFIGWLVCVAVSLVLQPAQAGERKHGAPVAVQAHASRAVVVPSPARSSLRTDVPQTLHHAVMSARGELSFVAVSPLGSEVRDPRSGAGSATGPSTSPRERKSLTLFRLDPKFGDVSVQPVVGGVNGAQVSMGF